MFRFFVENRSGDHFILSKEILKHLKVVRAEHENFICIHKKNFFECKLVGEEALIIRELSENHEFTSEVVLAAGIIETKNWEFMIQKATELGVTKIIPMYSNNVSKKVPDIDQKVERWNKIVLNAAEQSFRNVCPVVTSPLKFSEVIKLPHQNKFIAHEKKDAEVKASYPQNSLFLVGPEGGFSENEITEAIANGFEVLSLGKRILRAETASLFILSKVL